MKNLTIEATKSSPKVVLDCQTHRHSIIGESYPENSTEFYEPILEWLEEYVQTLDAQAHFVIELIYFNSSSSKALMDIFDILDEASQEGKAIVVDWMHDSDDEALQEYGDEFKEDVVGLDFNIKAKNPQKG